MVKFRSLKMRTPPEYVERRKYSQRRVHKWHLTSTTTGFLRTTPLSPTPDEPSRAMDAGGCGVAGAGEQLSLAAVRDQLIREEDSIVFALIERAKRPGNAPAYSAIGGSLAEFFVREAEALHAKASHFPTSY